MASATLERKERPWLDSHADEWVGAGLISGDQAAAIRQYEQLDQPAPARRLTLVAEIAIYLGGVIAFAGGAAIVGPNWDEIGVVGQLAIGVAVAVVGFLVGTRAIRFGEAGTERLGWFLWLVGTGGVALAAGAVMNRVDPSDAGWYPLVIGLCVLVTSSALWRNLDRPLQLLTAGLGLGLTGGGLAALTDASAWVTAPVTWGVAAGFGVLAAFGRVQPRLVALAMSGVGLMIGSSAFAGVNERLAAIIALLTAAGIVVFAMYDRSIPLLGLGMIAFFIGTTAMMQAVLQGMVWRLIAVVIGLAVVAYVAVRAQRMGTPTPQ
jgi:hypothetical protein